jgi:hypothetical protein
MTLTVRQKLEAGPMFDSNIIEHHFALYMRDYNVLVETYTAVPTQQSSDADDRYLYRFTHCVMAYCSTVIQDETWRVSWDNVFTEYERWRQADEPPGFVWGVNYATAYPGLRYIDDSALAQRWTERLQRPMHEVVIETNVYNLQLVFHDVDIHKVTEGQPSAILRE